MKLYPRLQIKGGRKPFSLLLAGAVALIGFHKEQSILSRSLKYTRTFSVLISTLACALLRSSSDCLHRCFPDCAQVTLQDSPPISSSQKRFLLVSPRLRNLHPLSCYSWRGPSQGLPEGSLWTDKHFPMNSTC